MEYIIGIVLAIGVSAMATVVGYDRDRALYPILTIIVATYYGLFAVLGGSTDAIIRESVVIVAYMVVAAISFKFNLWLAAAALVGHGIFDIFHARLIDNPGVPSWWPMFCMSYDV